MVNINDIGVHKIYEGTNGASELDHTYIRLPLGGDFWIGSDPTDGLRSHADDNDAAAASLTIDSWLEEDFFRSAASTASDKCNWEVKLEKIQNNVWLHLSSSNFEETN